MDKFLKRKAEDGSEGEPAGKAARGGGLVLVALPGAGGALSKGMDELVLMPLEGKGFKVRRPAGGKLKWNTFAAKHADNCAAVLSLCPPAGQDFFLMGNSFGNRVIAEMLTADKVPAHCRGVVMCGFPLYGEKNIDDRLKQLKAIPKKTTLMMISGTDDEFLNREFLPIKGRALLTAELEALGLTGHHEVHFVDGGGHDVPKCRGGKAAISAAAAKTVDLISSFCSRDADA